MFLHEIYWLYVNWLTFFSNSYIIYIWFKLATFDPSIRDPCPQSEQWEFSADCTVIAIIDKDHRSSIMVIRLTTHM